MDMNQINSLSPFVRFVKITKAGYLAGEWLDYDNVFTYIEQGEAVFMLGGTTYPIAEGDVVLMHPFMPHVIRTTSEVPLIQYIFHFDCNYDPVRSQWKEIGVGGEPQRHVPDREMLFASLSPVAHIREVDRIQLKKRFLMMHKEYMDNRYLDSLLLKSSALDLLAIFLRNQTSQPAKENKATKGWSIIEKCINLMQQHFSDPALDNHKISEHAGISTSHLSHLFKEQLGITVHKYLTYVRIDHTKRKILEGEDTLTQIADEAGFSSIHHFSRTFKNMVGMTASRYMAVHSSSSTTNGQNKPVKTRRIGDK
ncbi:helix-turn-helix transcriptional regulator [Paenibacillus pinihumi]|uniref:helix-turn-helix transcriptional regulator n=1 Tax=Paenibacillus pinihumi TaxID=669462 RepID=UPI000410CDC5|nr:AraC family transcriptional regulator [Paenibacillus pinihumi]